jgi:hypothetical protein
MPFKPIPPQEELRRVFDYSPEFGLLFWKYRDDIPKEANTRWAGKECGSLTLSGMTVRYKGVLYLVHRIIYVWWYGDVLSVDDIVDHADLNIFHNEIGNLRKATPAQNLVNRERQANNTSGAKGVDRLPGGSWRVRVGGIYHNVYPTFEEAVLAYNEEVVRRYGEFGRPTSLQM